MAEEAEDLGEASLAQRAHAFVMPGAVLDEYMGILEA